MKNLLFFSLLFCSIQGFAQKYYRGILEGEDKNYKNIPLKAPLTRSWNLVGSPNAFSLKKYAPKAKSQGPYGTCTEWAVGYAARTIIQAQQKGWTNKELITQNAFSPTFQYRLAGSYYDCSGAMTSDVVESLQSVGSVPMKDFSPQNGDVLCPGLPLNDRYISMAGQYKIEEFTKLWELDDYSYNTAKVNKVKTSLSQGNPVAISMICPNSFDLVGDDGLWRPTESPDDDLDGRQHGRHALCVIGYDNNKFGGAFEVQNSWGDDWGNDGFVWIKYQDFKKFVYQAFEIVHFPAPAPKEPYLAGSLRLFDMDDQQDLVVLQPETYRNWNVVGSTNKNSYTYKVKPNLQSGSKMRMYLKSEQPAFVYMLGSGEVDKSVATLFPTDGLSPAMNYKNSEIALPSEKHWFEMDNTAGKNYIVVIFSKEKLDLDEITREVKSGDGTFSQNISTALEDYLIDSKYIDFDKGEIKFEVEQNNSKKTAFAMIIEFNQVD